LVRDMVFFQKKKVNFSTEEKIQFLTEWMELAKKELTYFEEV